MKTFINKIKFIHFIIVILGCLFLFFVYIFFMLSPIPWYIYNNIINRDGLDSVNTLESYDDFKVKTVFVDSIELDKFYFETKDIEKFDFQSGEYYAEQEIQKNHVKIGNITVENLGEYFQYDPSSITACLENKEGNSIYGLEIEFDSPNNYTKGNSFLTIPKNTKTIIDINASLDGRIYDRDGYWIVESYKPLKLDMGGKKIINSSDEFSVKNLKKIILYRTATGKTMKGNFPYSCGSDFYNEKAIPIKTIEIL